jgi:hypothetical protein
MPCMMGVHGHVKCGYIPQWRRCSCAVHKEKKKNDKQTLHLSLQGGRCDVFADPWVSFAPEDGRKEGVRPIYFLPRQIVSTVRGSPISEFNCTSWTGVPLSIATPRHPRHASRGRDDYGQKESRQTTTPRSLLLALQH